MYNCTKCRVCADFPLQIALFVFAVRMLNPCVQCMPCQVTALHSFTWMSLRQLRQVVTKRQKGGFDRSWNVRTATHTSPSPSSPPSEPSETLCHWNWSRRSHCKEQNWKDDVQMSVFRYVTCDMSWDVTEHGRIEMDLSMTCYVWRFARRHLLLASKWCSWAALCAETGVVGVHHASVSPWPRSPHFAVCRMDYVSPWIFGEADETELWFATELRRKVKKLITLCFLVIHFDKLKVTKVILWLVKFQHMVRCCPKTSRFTAKLKLHPWKSRWVSGHLVNSMLWSMQIPFPFRSIQNLSLWKNDQKEMQRLVYSLL